MINSWEIRGPSSDATADLDVLILRYEKWLGAAEKRWDALQDAAPEYDDVESETPRGVRLWALCERAEERFNEIKWRLEEIRKAYNLLEALDTSVSRTREQNRRNREKKTLLPDKAKV